MKDGLRSLAAEALACRRCPRLTTWLAHVQRDRRAAFRDETYWCRPVPSFGPGTARLLVVGLAPGAHGANRTGRPFTGDGAGPFLFGALHRAGFASGPESVARHDDLRLIDARITNAVRCAPPGNRPTPRELAACRSFLAREILLLRRARVLLGLGEVAWKALLAALELDGVVLPRPRPRFAHGAHAELTGPAGAPVHLLGSYHPSQLNVNTGRLTARMMDRVLARSRELLDAL